MLEGFVTTLPSVQRIMHAYVAWWVLLAVFMGIMALMVKYYPQGPYDDE